MPAHLAQSNRLARFCVGAHVAAEIAAKVAFALALRNNMATMAA
jgi:hypothetical protein